MINLDSSPTPEATARLEYLECLRVQKIAAGEDLPRTVSTGYRDPLVKPAIVAETNGKCAYCESKVTHIYWGDVEHILAKSVYPDLLLDYSNLTLACSICNCNKSDYDDPECQLLNPYVDSVEACLLALGPLIWHRPANARAETTIVTLKLNRSDLVERRERRLTDVSRLVDKYASLPDGALRDAVLQQIQQEADSSAEFAFIVRHYLDRVGIPLSGSTGAA